MLSPFLGTSHFVGRLRLLSRSLLSPRATMQEAGLQTVRDPFPGYAGPFWQQPSGSQLRCQPANLWPIGV
jgi:hypothetical protein